MIEPRTYGPLRQSLDDCRHAKQPRVVQSLAHHVHELATALSVANHELAQLRAAEASRVAFGKRQLATMLQCAVLPPDQQKFVEAVLAGEVSHEELVVAYEKNLAELEARVTPAETAAEEEPWDALWGDELYTEADAAADATLSTPSATEADVPEEDFDIQAASPFPPEQELLESDEVHVDVSATAAGGAELRDASTPPAAKPLHVDTDEDALHIEEPTPSSLQRLVTSANAWGAKIFGPKTGDLADENDDVD